MLFMIDLEQPESSVTSAQMLQQILKVLQLGYISYLHWLQKVFVKETSEQYASTVAQKVSMRHYKLGCGLFPRWGIIVLMAAI